MEAAHFRHGEQCTQVQHFEIDAHDASIVPFFALYKHRHGRLACGKTVLSGGANE
jgi:hypothetical protein